MPDDERLGGTRDPHESGRRHRREDGEQPRRRRRSMENSGGLSVADLVQKHTGSRPDLTPVDPNVPLSQNTLMHGRRSLEVRHPGGIAEALDGGGSPEGLRNGFPDATQPPRRRESHAAPPEPPRPAPHSGLAPEPDLPKRGRRTGESSTFFAEQPGEPPANAFFTEHQPGEQAVFPDTATPPRKRGRRGGPKDSAHLPAPAEPNGYPPPGPNAYADPNGYPAEPPAPGRHGETSARMPIDPNGIPGEAPNRGRRGETSARMPIAGDPNGYAAEPPASRRGETSARMPIDPNGDPNGFPGEAPSRSRRGETSARMPITGDPNGYAAEPPASRRGETSAHLPVDPNGYAAEPPAPGRRGEASAHLPVVDDLNGFPADSGRRGRRGEAVPGDAAEVNGLPKRGRRGRKNAETPDGFPAGMGAPRGVGGRRPGESSSARLPIPGDGFPAGSGAPRGVGDAGMPGPNGFEPPNRGRGPGEASAHLPVPPRPQRGETGQFPIDGTGQFPVDAPPRPGQSSGRFPTDDPRRQGPPTPPPANRQGPPTPPPANRQGPPTPPPANRQGPPTPPPANRPGPLTPPPANRQGPLSEPRLTPAAIDAPDPRRSTGVPPVPMMPPVRRDDDPISMTTEMEAIGEEVQKRRSIDHTLARFSAVHDEIRAEEREKKAKRRKLLPWQNGEDEMARLDELDAQQSMAMQIPVVPRDEAPEAEEEDDPRGKKKKKKKRKLKGKLAGKVFTAIVAGLVFTSTAAAWGFKSYIEASSQNVDALDPDSKAIQDAAAQRGDENFLLVGSDTRAGAVAEEGVGDENEVVGARSDTVMIAHIPKNRERAVVVSFPRDLEVTRPACEGWDPKTGEYNGTQHPAAKRVKLNTAYQVGGPKCVTKMVQELSGLAVNHFVGIDFHGFKGMVDAVQGVEVCVERPLKDSVLGTVVPEAGKNVSLTGDQALNFVRARHVEGDPTSDYGRITRQQRFLSALLRKAMSSEVLFNPGKLTDFIDAFSKATFGDNIGVDQLFTLGQSMQGIDAGRVTFITVPTVGESNERGNEELRAEDNAALFEAIRQDTPLPGETPVPDDASQQGQHKASSLQQDQPAGPVDPKTIKLQVLNGGNDQDGIAGDTADSLAEYGFQIVRTGSAPENVDTTVIRYSKARAAQAQTLQAAVPGATLQEDASMSGAIMLIIGPGFDGNVVSPNGGGPVAEVPDGLSTVNAGDVSCA